jgi:hypothetical protein
MSATATALAAVSLLYDAVAAANALAPLVHRMMAGEKVSDEEAEAITQAARGRLNSSIESFDALIAQRQAGG